MMSFNKILAFKASKKQKALILFTQSLEENCFVKRWKIDYLCNEDFVVFKFGKFETRIKIMNLFNIPYFFIMN